jgi:hypothetical protein
VRRRPGLDTISLWLREGNEGYKEIWKGTNALPGNKIHR